MSCTWVQDDADECPYGFWLKLRYTYNILDVDAATKYVDDAYVYIYDDNGNFIKRIYANHDALAANDYKVRVEGIPEGNYQFVVWSGMTGSQYAVSGDTKTIGDFRLSLTSSGNTQKSELTPLYHGYLSTVHYDDNYALHHVEMMKNTNHLACSIVSVSGQVVLDPDEFVMKVVTANSTMNAYNELISADDITYEPYVSEQVTINDAEYGTLNGVKTAISILRLMSDRETRVILEKKSTGQTVFNISFPEYIGKIGSLYTNLGREISVQEYLDRQDFYTIVFVLSGDLDQLIQVKVNQWRVRAYEHVKL